MTNGIEILKLEQNERICYTVHYYDNGIKTFKEFDDIDYALDYAAFLLTICDPITLKNVKEKFRS